MSFVRLNTCKILLQTNIHFFDPQLTTPKNYQHLSKPYLFQVLQFIKLMTLFFLRFTKTIPLVYGRESQIILRVQRQGLKLSEKFSKHHPLICFSIMWIQQQIYFLLIYATECCFCMVYTKDFIVHILENINKCFSGKKYFQRNVKRYIYLIFICCLIISPAQILMFYQGF